jgi:3-hydroxypropanoate dehydrogenase
MSTPISESAMKQLFTEARTHHVWTNKPVADTTLREIYELAKWGPTSANSLPMRVVYVKSAAQKEKLLPTLLGSNVDQVKAAPVTAIIAYDKKFYDQLPTLFPIMDLRPMFANNEAMAQQSAFQSSTLQGAYFMLAARALGLDVGAMGGFDSAKVDEAFFKGSNWKSNFLCNIGYGDHTRLYPRGPRLDYEFACKVI